MDGEQMKSQVTELHVRMDCNGCVQKIKKALHNLEDIDEVYIDVPHQKLTVVGIVEPEKIVKAIKKTRKIATICTPAEATVETSSSEAQKANQAPTEPMPTPTPTPLPPLEQPIDSSTTENQVQDIKPETEPAETVPSKPKDVEEIHKLHYHPHNSRYREHWNAYPRGHETRLEDSPDYVIHSYNNYRPSPYISEYIYNREIPQRSEFYGYGNNHNKQGGNGSQITSMFSEENPNACKIV